jgi:hypothetical protein
LPPYETFGSDSKRVESPSKIACPEGLKSQAGQAIITAKNREKSIDNKRPPKPIKRYSFSLSEREKVGGEKGGVRRLWECGKPVGFSIISTAGARGERGR